MVWQNNELCNRGSVLADDPEIVSGLETKVVPAPAPSERAVVLSEAERERLRRYAIPRCEYCGKVMPDHLLGPHFYEVHAEKPKLLPHRGRRSRRDLANEYWDDDELPAVTCPQCKREMPEHLLGPHMREAHRGIAS